MTFAVCYWSVWVWMSKPDYCFCVPSAIWPVEMSGYVGAAVFGILRQPEITRLYVVAMAASRRLSVEPVCIWDPLSVGFWAARGYLLPVACWSVSVWSAEARSPAAWWCSQSRCLCPAAADAMAVVLGGGIRNVPAITKPSALTLCAQHQHGILNTRRLFFFSLSVTSEGKRRRRKKFPRHVLKIKQHCLCSEY